MGHLVVCITLIACRVPYLFCCKRSSSCVLVFVQLFSFKDVQEKEVLLLAHDLVLHLVIVITFPSSLFFFVGFD